MADPALPLQVLENFIKNNGLTLNEADNTLPEVKQLIDLVSAEYGSDPNELIAYRFLYRGAVCLVIGPTGIGKSSFLMQLAIHLASGRGLFGIEPGLCYAGTGYRILLVQAENDEGDLAEMRDGVLRVCSDLTDEQKQRAQENIVVCTITDKTSDKFAKTLDALLTEDGNFDLVVVDPAFAYLGGDSNSQQVVSHFMRELLNPLLQKHKVGMLLAHHSNKPLRGKEKDGWAAGDFSYLGAGSAEWVNPARAALAIRSVGSDHVFELRAAKRGRRLRWEDAEGMTTNIKFIAHSEEPGVICWHEATEDEIEAAKAATSVGGGGGRTSKCTAQDASILVAMEPGKNQKDYVTKLAIDNDCSTSTAQNAINQAVALDLIMEQKSGRSKTYSLTETGALWTHKYTKGKTKDQN